MYKIFALIGNGQEVLCEKICFNAEAKFCLPSASASSIKVAQSKIKQDLKKLDFIIFFDNLIYKNKDSKDVILVYNCILQSYRLQGSNEYEWLPIKNYIEKQTYYCNESVEKWIKNHFIKFIDLEKELNELKDLLYVQSETKIEIQLHLDSIKFFIYSNHAFCPFAFCVDYNIEDEDVRYNFRWQIVRQIAPGNKSDIYIFFLSSMAALLKMKCNIPVFIAMDNYLGIPFEINTGYIYFEMDHTKTRKKLKDFAQIILLNFDNFNLMMMVHNTYFGTIANDLLEIDKHLASEPIFEHFGEYEKICRQETTLLYNERIFYIELDKDNYNYNELIKEYEYELLKGVNGSLLFQKYNCEQEKHVLTENYIDDKTWKIVNFIIKKNKFKNYQLCAQSNMMFIFTPDGLWGVAGNFHHKLAKEERDNLLKRQDNENRLLLINRKFKWKYPLNPSRFEQLIAELIEQQKPMAKVRLMGKTNNADGGRDILVYEKINDKDKLTIVQCKAYKNSVNKHHVTDIRDTIEHYEASGFFLATSSTITTQLNDHLIKLKNKFEIDWWTEREIFKLLRQYPIIVNEYEDLLTIVN